MMIIYSTKKNSSISATWSVTTSCSAIALYFMTVIHFATIRNDVWADNLIADQLYTDAVWFNWMKCLFKC